MLITSLDNKKIKDVVKLQNKKFRDENNLFIIETPNLINEAYSLGFLKEIYKLEDYDLSLDVPTYDVTESVMNKIKQVKTSKVLGIAYKKNSNEIMGNRILLLDGVSDPGNLGTIIRSAVGFNVDTIVLSKNSIDLYNDKVIRASEGAIFKINIIREDLVKIINLLKESDIPIYKTDVKNGELIENINKDKYVIIIGSEGNGISDEVNCLVEKSIHIKTNNIESLNVAIATSIILYELDK